MCSEGTGDTRPADPGAASQVSGAVRQGQQALRSKPTFGLYLIHPRPMRSGSAAPMLKE